MIIHKSAKPVLPPPRVIYFIIRARPQLRHINDIIDIHTLRVHYTHAAANLNLGYSKYAK